MMWDPIDFFNAKDAKECELLKRLPICDECGEPIQGEFIYSLGAEDYCEDCANRIDNEFEVDFDKRRNEV